MLDAPPEWGLDGETFFHIQGAAAASLREQDTNRSKIEKTD
jgi:hypothetical protein